VIKILTEKTKPTVVVRWDPMPDVDGKENSIEETQQELPQRKWNKDVEGAWRLESDKQNHRRLKAIVIKYNMIIIGLLCEECIVQTYKHTDI